MKTIDLAEGVVAGRLARVFLREDGDVLRKCSEKSRSFHDLGRWYTVNGRNCVTRTHLDLEEDAREAGILQAWEQVATE